MQQLLARMDGMQVEIDILKETINVLKKTPASTRKVVRRIMAEEGLVVLVKSRRKYNSYQGELSPSVPNTVNRDFHSEKPNEKWLTDITEFAIPAGKVYLSPVVDCFDGMLPW